jgi:hypothetical protein
MLLCRGCGTRFETGQEACPSCGRRAKTHAVEAGASDSGLPPAAGAPADEDSAEDSDELEPDELEVDEPTIADEPEIEEPVPVREPIPVPIPAPRRASKKAAAPAPEPAPLRAPAPAAQKASASPAPAPIAARRKRAETVVPPLALDLAQVRALLTEQPGLIEKGLGVHADAAGRPVGVDFETPVGSIDLLARDLRGGYVVLMVLEPEDTDDLVPALLRRMGWVRKHLCSAGEAVRAIAVVSELPESALYAAAGLGDGALRFVGYRVSLDFHEHA